MTHPNPPVNLSLTFCAPGRSQWNKVIGNCHQIPLQIHCFTHQALMANVVGALQDLIRSFAQSPGDSSSQEKENFWPGQAALDTAQLFLCEVTCRREAFAIAYNAPYTTSLLCCCVYLHCAPSTPLLTHAHFLICFY
jgi:hypothetical protein